MHSSDTGEKLEYNETVQHLFTYFQKANDSESREELYNILIEFLVPMKLIRLIKTCLFETQKSGTRQLLVYADK
jgi:hypothetical protein